MLGGEGVASQAPPPGTGPNAGPRITISHANHNNPHTQRGDYDAIYRRRITLVP